MTGKLRWHNGFSGDLAADNAQVGISVQGHLLWHEGRVYLAGGNVISPAVYDAASGKCLNTLNQKPKESLDDHWKMQRSARGSELFVVENRVVPAGSMLYAPPSPGPPSGYFPESLIQLGAGETIIQGTSKALFRAEPRRKATEKPKVIWRLDRYLRTQGVVLTGNVLLVAGELNPKRPDGMPRPVLSALDPENGKLLWEEGLPARAVRWGIAVGDCGGSEREHSSHLARRADAVFRPLIPW